jgi:hypothetical protein
MQQTNFSFLPFFALFSLSLSLLFVCVISNNKKVPLYSSSTVITARQSHIENKRERRRTRNGGRERDRKAENAF